MMALFRNASVYENGKMKFKIGDKFPSIYYQIVMM